MYDNLSCKMQYSGQECSGVSGCCWLGVGGGWLQGVTSEQSLPTAYEIPVLKNHKGGASTTGFSHKLLQVWLTQYYRHFSQSTACYKSDCTDLSW